MMNDIEVPDTLPEAARVSLQRQGYRGQTLRDPDASWHPSQHDQMRAEVQQAVAYLQQHVFPLHGLKA
jgi:hypothetical protein